uniref:Uncharacterized protein n=1 Tax=Ciona savignyi TaxID=51511 RepID=H2Y8U6_CIOSA
MKDEDEVIQHKRARRTIRNPIHKRTVMSEPQFDDDSKRNKPTKRDNLNAIQLLHDVTVGSDVRPR